MPIPKIIGIILLWVKVLVWYCYNTIGEKKKKTLLKHIFTRKMVQINTIYKKLYKKWQNRRTQAKRKENTQCASEGDSQHTQ